MKVEPTSTMDYGPSIKAPGAVEKLNVPFTNWLTETISGTNQQLLKADHALQQLAHGHTASLHQTMLSLEQAKLSLQFLEQIRNRIMAAYQEIIREQI